MKLIDRNEDILRKTWEPSKRHFKKFVREFKEIFDKVGLQFKPSLYNSMENWGNREWYYYPKLVHKIFDGYHKFLKKKESK